MPANNSLLDTNLSTSPYFDDYDPTKNFQKILFKPRTAVQTRELNQIQSMIQNQISTFGKDIYKDGSVIGGGCALTYDNNYSFVKMRDTYANTTALTISSLQGLTVRNSRGLTAKVINTVQGLESRDPNFNTIYVKYLNSSLTPYANGVYQTKFDANEQLQFLTASGTLQGNVFTASTPTVSGYGYAVTVGEGVIFKKGYFVNVPTQTLIVGKYYNTPDNISVGFNIKETIVTSSSDPSLFDNAAGAPNYSAPGADRLMLEGILEAVVTDQINPNTFFSIVDFKAGFPVTNRTDTQFNSIQREVARRTYETNGNFVVEPFTISSTPLANTSDPDYANYFSAVVSRGLGYVNGYRVEYINNNTVKARRGTDVDSISSQLTSLNFGYYVVVNELSGDFTNSSEIVPIELHNVAKTSITSRNFLNSSQYNFSTKIGTAYVKGFTVDNGFQGTSTGQYRIYLFNVKMNAGANFKDVKSVIYYESSLVKGVADVVLQPNVSSATNVASIQNFNLNSLIYPFGQKAIAQDLINNIQFDYRKVATTSMLTNGQANVSVSVPVPVSSGESFLYLGTLSSTQMDDFIVVPTSNGYSTKAGTVTTSSSTTTVTGSGTCTFLTDYFPGDFIYINSTLRKVVSITNDTTLIVDANFGGAAGSAQTHKKIFVAGNPIPFASRFGRSMSVDSSNKLTLNINESVDVAFNIQVVHSLARKGARPIKKNINKTVFVKIDCFTHPNKNIGPWSLGIPDVLSLDGVYIDYTGTSFPSNTSVNYVSNYSLNNGQRETYYDLASFDVMTNSLGDNLPTDAKILVQLSAFTYDTSQGVGFFTANSYPVDDSNFNASNRIATYQIPSFNSSTGVFYDLRDSVDFRPYATNTANVATATIYANVNPSSTLSFNYTPYLPVPDSAFQADIGHYLPRVDRVAIDINGQIVITEGKPSSSNPVPPPEKQQTMTLGFLKIPAYPSLTVTEAAEQNRYDIAIQSQTNQNKRYTMKDIGQFDRRIKNLEYYTSLSLLEQSAAAMQVRSSTTGQTRFQNGIFVDPFNGPDLTNFTNPKCFIAFDIKRSEIRPHFIQVRSEFEFNQTQSNIENGGSQKVLQYGELVMLKHETDIKPYISQQYNSKYRYVVEGNVLTYRGTVTLTPTGSAAPDITKGADVLESVDTATNWVYLAEKAWNTQWGNWHITSTDLANTIISAAHIVNQHVDATGTTDSTTYQNVFNDPADIKNTNSVDPTPVKSMSTTIFKKD
jgi:hypothetical protein